MKKAKLFFQLPLLVLLVLLSRRTLAQTSDDAIMMKKQQWCNGITYMHSQWKDYWEGTLKRDNLNLGNVSTQTLMFMTNYGITDKLNVIVGVPYVWTHATAGTLSGQKGFQDIMLDVKWEGFHKKYGQNSVSLFAVGGISTPLSKYEIDFQPMSIGMGSTNLTGRLTADYQRGSFFATLSGAYVFRNNVKLDRTSYYTTELHLTDEVRMPDQVMANLNVGYRHKGLVAEAVLMHLHTLGGFDMRRNDMPFVSNRMNGTTVGAHVKYFLPFIKNLELIGGADFAIDGKSIGLPESRNTGKADTYTGGLYYLLNL